MKECDQCGKKFEKGDEIYVKIGRGAYSGPRNRYYCSHSCLIAGEVRDVETLIYGVEEA